MNYAKHIKLMQKLQQLPLAISVGLLACASHANQYNLRSESLSDALMEFSEQSGVEIILPGNEVAGLANPGLQGDYSVEAGLDALLKNSGLGFRKDSNNVFIIYRDDSRQKKIGSKPLSKKDKEIEEMVVTASRRKQNLQDVPMSITSVEPDDFVAAGLTKLSDVVDYTPGFYSKTNIFGRPGVGIALMARGATQDVGTSPIVATYLDDIPLTNNGPWANSSFASFDGLLGDIERIELLKGPQGTLYGATSISGAVKFVTRKPSLDEVRGYTSVDFSATERGGFNKIYSGRISTPVVEDRLGITIAGFYDDNAGFVDRIDAATGSVLSEDADDVERYGFSADALYKFSDKFEFRGRLMHQKSKMSGSSLVRLNVNTFEPLFGRYESPEAVSDHVYETTYYSATFGYEFGWATLTSSSGYVEGENPFGQDFVSSYGALADVTQNQPVGTTTSLIATQGRGSEKFVQEIRLTSENGNVWEWLLGVYYTDEKAFDSSTWIAHPNNYNLYTNSGNESYEESAVFGNLTYYVTPDFDLTVGARFSKNKTEKVQTASGGLIPGGSRDAQVDLVKETVDTWLFAARYRANENLSLYARLASGYRPAFNTTVVVDPITGDTLPPFVSADTIWSYEIGAKGDFADGLLSYDVALWYIQWDDFHTRISLAGVGGTINASGGITAQGLDSTFTIRPTDGFSIISGISYADSTLNENEPLLNGSAGQQVPYVPEWSASTRVRYEFVLGVDTNAHIGGGIRYTGSSRSAFTDNIGTFIPGVSDLVADAPFDPAFNVPIEKYIQVDLNAGITLGNLVLNLYATNLLNENVYLSTDGDITGGNNVIATGVPLRPRTIGASLSFSF